MALRRGPGVAILLGTVVLASLWFAASSLGLVPRLREWVSVRAPSQVRLSAGDFPAGVSAPVGEVASVPLRPTLIGLTARGSSASILLATGGATSMGEAAAPPVQRPGVLQTAYALDARALLFTREEELRRALTVGGDAGGVDMAALGVDRLADWTGLLRDAAPRTLMLVGRSRGQEALAAVGINSLLELRGKRLGATSSSSAYYFGLWLLSRAGLSVNDVRWVNLPSTLDAGRALREGRVDAAIGIHADVELAARDRGGKVLVSTVDAPHLLSTVLVVRGEFAARYPDAVRRVIRGVLDAQAQIARDPGPAARLLGEVAPALGDPLEAIASAPPSNLADNLAFFGLKGEAPVTYDELFQSASTLFSKIKKTTPSVAAADTRDLGALKYVAEARGP